MECQTLFHQKNKEKNNRDKSCSLPKPNTFIEMKNFQKLQATKNLMTQLINAVSFLHKKGIIHRDIKP